MHNADLYKISNAMQRRDARDTMDEYASRFQWRADGRDTLLDIGCGSGDVTMDFILPTLPGNFKRLVGADASKEMVEYSSKHYLHPRVIFEYLDLGVELHKQSLYESEPFDHITSFYCLHWEPNQDIAIKNMSQLLKPGGDMLLTLMAYNPIFDIYKQLSQQSTWAKYMTDVDRFISPYHFCKNPTKKIRQILISHGFTENTVDIREKSYIFKGVDTLKNALKAVNPFYDRIPEKDQHAYFDDYLQYAVKMGLNVDDYNLNRQCHFNVPYKLMVVYARK